MSVTDVLVRLVRRALTPDRGMEWGSVDIDWAQLYRTAATQGVLALAWDGLMLSVQAGELDRECLPKSLKLQWAYNVEKVQKRYDHQLRSAKEFAAMLSEADIRTLVLKGFAIARLYPIPSHRECGDLDCFLPQSYEQGNVLAEQAGAEVERDYYKHSHINYRRLVIENHQFCTAFRGSDRARRFERLLQQVMLPSEPRYIADSRLESPSGLFNALFLTKHSLAHLLTEGISLRHLTDWAVLLRSEDVDWKRFNELCEEYKLRRFADTMTRLAVKELGVESPYDCGTEQSLDRRLLEEILSDWYHILNSRMAWWRQQTVRLVNMVRAGWKYSLSDTSRTALLWQLIRGFLFEREPKL